MKIFNFISPLPPEECLRRLRANVEREKWTWSTGSAPSKAEVVGKVEETRIRLHRPNTGNSFSKHLFGRLTGDGNQTRLRCRIGLHPFVIAFMVFWAGGVLFMGRQAIAQGHGTMTVSFFGLMTVFEGWWVGIAAPLILLCSGVAIVVLGCFFARDEEKILIDFLRKTIDVRDA
jgi:hypothetical protein